MSQTKYNLSASNANFPTEFAASHFAVLAKLRQRVLDAADKPDISLSEVDKAVTIEIKIANYLHKIKEREEKALRDKQPRTQPSPPTATSEPRPAASPTASTQTPDPSACCQLRL